MERKVCDEKGTLVKAKKIIHGVPTTRRGDAKILKFLYKIVYLFLDI